MYIYIYINTHTHIYIYIYVFHYLFSHLTRLLGNFGEEIRASESYRSLVSLESCALSKIQNQSKFWVLPFGKMSQQ